MTNAVILSIVVIVVVAIVCLSILCLAYWLIFHQDGSILATVGSIVGGIIGYTFKSLKKR